MHDQSKVMSEHQSCSSSTNGQTPGSPSSQQSQQQLQLVHQPMNASELQLFLVLQRANLLNYYDTFISQGGDDVQQLLEAAEEEFLEIMALVGMASKPLHVRRLQKALQEYSLNPAAFQLSVLQKCGAIPNANETSVSPGAQAIVVGSVPFAGNGFLPNCSNSNGTGSMIGSSGLFDNLTYVSGCHQGAVISTVPAGCLVSIGVAAPNAVGGLDSCESPGRNSVQSNGSSLWPSPYGDNQDYATSDPCIAQGTTPTLTDAQAQRIAECAEEIVRKISEIEPKMVQNKKRIARDLVMVMELPTDSPVRLDEFRRYAAIYGRFDAKRKPDKPLTLHEVCVNEAAAQICLHRPALLTRRDELFPLARQVVRDAGYNYVKSGRHKFSSDDVLLENSALRTRKRPATTSDDDGDNSGSPVTSNYSGGQTSPDSNALTVSLSPPVPSTSADADSCSEPNEFKRRRKRLDEIGMQLQMVSRAQDTCKRRVDAAQEINELHAIQRELHTLTQRQMELSDEQAQLLSATDKTELFM